MVLKKSIYGENIWKKKAGRPKLRWLDCTDKVWIRWASRYEGRKKKTDLYGLWIWRRRWLNYKGRTPMKKKTKRIILRRNFPPFPTL